MSFIKKKSLFDNNFQEKAKKLKIKNTKDKDIHISVAKSKSFSFGRISFGSTGGVKINGKVLIVKSLGYQTVGFNHITKKVVTKKDIGRSAARILDYMKREDSAQDLNKEELADNSLVYNHEKLLSKEEVSEIRKDWIENGIKGGQHHLIISSGQDLDREENAVMVRNTMSRFKEETGKNFDYQFVFHTDKGENEDGSQKNPHSHVLLTSDRKNDIKITQEQLQMLKIIAAEETLKIVDSKNDSTRDLDYQIDKDKKHLVNMQISNNLQNNLSEERKNILEIEKIELQIGFKEFVKDIEFKSGDIELLKEIQKAEGNLTFLERQDHYLLKEKDLHFIDQKLNQLNKGFDTEKLTELKEIKGSLSNEDFDKYEKVMAAKNYQFSINKLIETKDREDSRLVTQKDLADLDKANKWVANEEKKLSPEDKAVADKFYGNEWKQVDKIIDFENQKSILLSKSAEQIKNEKIDFVNNKIAELNSKLEDTMIKETLLSLKEEFIQSNKAESIHLENTDKRLVAASDIGKKLEEQTGWKDQEVKLVDREKELHKNIDFNMNSILSSLSKDKTILEAEIANIKESGKDNIDNNVADQLKEIDKTIKRDSDTVFVKESNNESGKKEISESEIWEKIKEVGAERNKLKAEGNEETFEFRNKQKEFINLQLVLQNGLDLNKLEAWKKTVTEVREEKDKNGEIVKIEPKMTIENAEQYIQNTKKQSEELFKAGIFDKDFKFVDNKAKEILFENSDKSNSKLSEINLEAYKEVQNNNKEEIFKEKEINLANVMNTIHENVNSLSKDNKEEKDTQRQK